nr:hypothetical protein Itr_chr14CG15460 [Ipomoea trifida]
MSDEIHRPESPDFLQSPRVRDAGDPFPPGRPRRRPFPPNPDQHRCTAHSSVSLYRLTVQHPGSSSDLDWPRAAGDDNHRQGGDQQWRHTGSESVTGMP